MPVNIFTALDDPSARTGGATEAFGINASGQIVGLYTTVTAQHGFLLSGGTCTTLDDPSATLGTTASGVNGTGQIVGQYRNASGLHGFLLSGGMYTTLDDLLATSGTVASGINDTGQIVGYYQDASGSHGFLYHHIGGTYTTL